MAFWAGILLAAVLFAAGALVYRFITEQPNSIAVRTAYLPN
jgi:hypothetical protein